MEMEQASAFSFDMSYCGSPPTLGTLWGRWNFDPLLLVVLSLVGVVGLWMLRGNRRLAFAGAWGVALVLFVSPLCALTVALFSARVGHHAVLTMVAAPLLAIALQGFRVRLPLVVSLVVSTLALWLWHTPPIYAAAFAHPALYWAMQLSLLASFTWLWHGLLATRNALSSGLAALGSATQMGLLGALLVFAPSALYLPHLATTAAFGLSPLDDQQLAGLIMWVPANLPLMALVLWRLVGALPRDGKVAAR
jgi:putative membrane protein